MVIQHWFFKRKAAALDKKSPGPVKLVNIDLPATEIRQEESHMFNTFDSSTTSKKETFPTSARKSTEKRKKITAEL